MFRDLTARQEECLRLTRLMTDRQIASELGISETTVKKHVREACHRLGVNRRKAALAMLERKVVRPKRATLQTSVAAGPAPDPALPVPEASSQEAAAQAPVVPRFGYRPPPGDRLLRSAVIGAATVIGALTVGAVTDIVAGYHGTMQAIDDATRPDAPGPA